MQLMKIRSWTGRWLTGLLLLVLAASSSAGDFSTELREVEALSKLTAPPAVQDAEGFKSDIPADLYSQTEGYPHPT